MPVDLVHALPELRIFVGKELRCESLIPGLPGIASVIGSINSSGGARHERPLRIVRIENDGVQAQAASSGLPLWPVWMVEQSAVKRPGLSGIVRLKQCGRLHAAVHLVRLLLTPDGNLPDLFQGLSCIFGEFDRRAFWVGPRPAEIVAGMQHDSENIRRAGPQPLPSRTAIVGERGNDTAR